MPTSTESVAAQTISTSEVRKLLGYQSTNATRTQLVRWGLHPVGREPKERGALLWSADEVREKLADRRGRGRPRTRLPRQSRPD